MISLHNHTFHSTKDSAISEKDLVTAAQKKGFTSVALTNHGNLFGVYSFVDFAKEAGINPIVGCELYVGENRAHLLVLAKNYDGYIRICRAVSESFKHAKNVGNILMPTLEIEDLRKFFGGSDDVIVTTACVGGILGKIVLSNEDIAKEIEKLKAKALKFGTADQNIGQLEKDKASIEAEIAERTSLISNLKPIAERKFALRERAVAKLSGNEKDAAEQLLKKDREETFLAQKETEKEKRLLKEAKKRETLNRKALREAEETKEKKRSLTEQISALEASKKTEEDIISAIKETVNTLNEIFGETNVYIELQYHGLESEAKVYPLIARIGQELESQFMCSNDVHMTTNDEDSITARQIVRSMRFNQYEALSSDSAEYYLKTDDELREALSKILCKDVIEKAFAGNERIANECNISFPAENHYPKFPVVDGESAGERLRRLSQEGKERLFPTGWTQEYEERLQYELKVIDDMGFNDYLCIVQDFIAYAKKESLADDGVGVGVGSGRGSSAGSLVCYLTGITESIDPVKYGLFFERFLNPARKTMPDIDTDFSYTIRPRAIEYVKETYGENAVCGISTEMTTAAKNSIHVVARILGSRDEQSYADIAGEISRLIGPTDSLSDVDFSTITSPIGQEILKNARLIEGVVVGYGVHPAGIIISDNGDVREYVSLILSEEKGMSAQVDMMQSEDKVHLLKMDFLGLRNLNYLDEAVKSVYRNTGEKIDVYNLPFEKDVFENIFAKGETSAVFQFESGGMKSMLRRFKPKRFEDLILLVAAYRPGPMQYLDKIIRVKNGEEPLSFVDPSLAPILEETYGAVIYQEQVQQIFQRCAGYDLGSADLVRRAMSKKKMAILEVEKENFVHGNAEKGIAGCVANGIPEAVAYSLFEELTEFAKYAFNKAHAAAYAYLAYATGYFKYHFPAEYLCGAMLWVQDTDKIPGLISEAKALGVKVFPPDVNHSASSFTVRNGAIYFGLGSIKGIKSAANCIIENRKTGAYTDFKDFLRRSEATESTIEALIRAGGCDAFCSSRKAMLAALPDAYADVAKIRKKEAELATETNKKKVERISSSLSEYVSRLHKLVLPTYLVETKEERLQAERETLGLYISEHPLEGWQMAKTMRSSCIAEIEHTNETLCGAVRDLRIKQRKSDGKALAFFLLEDETGSIEVCCFTSKYEKYKDVLHEGSVLSIEGNVSTDDETTKLIVKTITTVPKDVVKICVVTDFIEWTDSVHDLVKTYESPYGDYEVVMYDRITGEFRTTYLRVEKEILHSGLTIRKIEEDAE